MTITYGQRPGCDAAAHDTLWAYNRHRCRCTAAVAAKNRDRGSRRRPVDPVKVQAAIRGERVRLTIHERRAAIAALADQPTTRVARVLQLARSTVYMHRKAATEAAA